MRKTKTYLCICLFLGLVSIQAKAAELTCTVTYPQANAGDSGQIFINGEYATIVIHESRYAQPTTAVIPADHGLDSDNSVAFFSPEFSLLINRRVLDSAPGTSSRNYVSYRHTIQDQYPVRRTLRCDLVTPAVGH